MITHFIRYSLYYSSNNVSGKKCRDATSVIILITLVSEIFIFTQFFCELCLVLMFLKSPSTHNIYHTRSNYLNILNIRTVYIYFNSMNMLHLEFLIHSIRSNSHAPVQ